MTQQRTLTNRFVKSSSLRRIQINPDTLLDTSGLFFKPAPESNLDYLAGGKVTGWQAGTPERGPSPLATQRYTRTAAQHFRTVPTNLEHAWIIHPTVAAQRALQSHIGYLEEITLQNAALVGMDTLPLASIPYTYLAAPAHSRGSHSPALALTAQQQKKTVLITVGGIIGFTLLAGAVITVFMIVPLMTALIPALPNVWSRLLIALEIMGVIEFIVCRILLKTVQRS